MQVLASSVRIRQDYGGLPGATIQPTFNKGSISSGRRTNDCNYKSNTHYIHVCILHIIERSLEIKLPTIWTDEKHSQEEAEPGRNSDVEKVRREKMGDVESQKKEDTGAGKGRKVAKDCVFPMFCGSGGSKGRLAKAAGAEVAGQMGDEKLHAVVARSTF